jgi:hypothetical protein
MHAVITGDIIHSTRLSSDSKSKLFIKINKYLKYLSNESGIKTEMYRGDSFQCLIENPLESLRIALLIKTYIRSLNPSEIYNVSKKALFSKVNQTVMTTFVLDARMAVGIAENESIRSTLANSDGMAFFLSGRLLDDIKNTKQHLAIESVDEFSAEWETECILLDEIIRRTTALQCKVINLKLEGYTETQIANKLNIGQSAVNQRSNSGGWRAIETMVNRFESAYNLD